MSQLFGTREDNKIQIRVNDVTANNVYQKNLLTGIYERVTNGSDIPALPYYLKSNSIDIDSGTNGSELSANALTLGDETGNETLTKEKIKILSQLKTNIVDFDFGNYRTPVAVGYNKTTNRFERLPAITIGATFQYTNMAQTGFTSTQDSAISRLNATSISLQNGAEYYNLNKDHFKSITQIFDNVATPLIGIHYNGKYLVNYNKNTDTFERATDFSLGTSSAYTTIDNLNVKVSNSVFYTLLNSQGLTIKYNTLTAYFNYEDVKTANKLYNPPLITPVANSKMIIFDTASRVYNTANIPTGTVLPSYLYPTSIEMTTDQIVKCSQGGDNISLKNGTIIANTATKPTLTLDYNKLKNIPKRTSYYLNSTADWTYAPYSDVSDGSITTAIKIPNFSLDCIGDNVYIQMSAYNSINLDTAGSGGLKAFIFTCPYLEKAFYNNRVKFEIKHLNPNTGDEAVIQYMLPVLVTNGSNSKKCFAFSAALNTFLGGTIRIKLLEYPFAINDDVLTASSFPSAAI